LIGERTAEARAYRYVLELLLRHEVLPGGRLAEMDIAKRLGISRTPVRNALRKLVAEGLLEIRENWGCYVPSLSPGDMAAVFEVREMLESKAAELAALNLEEGEEQSLLEILTEERSHYRSGDLLEYTMANNKLHLKIASLSKNPYLERFVRQSLWRSEIYVFFFDRFYSPKSGEPLLRDPDSSVSCQEHARIVRAITSRDPGLARELMASHVRTTYSLLTHRAFYL